MRAVGFGRVWKTAVRIRKRFTPKALILAYHRVAAHGIDPWSLCVTPRNFAEQLRVLRGGYAHPMSLKDLARAQQERRIPDRAVALTFDDGYAVNLYQANPLLEQYGVPSSVFVISGSVGKNREFWWDELEQLLLRPGKLPETLSLRVNGTESEWKIAGAKDYTQAEYRGDAGRHARKANPGSRLSFYHSLWKHLHRLREGEIREALEQISDWAEVKPAARSTHRPLTPDELSMLDRGGWVEVGAHTITHPMLTAHSLEIQDEEIRQCKADLEKILGHPVSSFAYPHGDLNAETVALVRQAGFTCGCSSVSENIWKKTDLMQVPRVGVGDWDGEEFAKRISEWFRS